MKYIPWFLLFNVGLCGFLLGADDFDLDKELANLGLIGNEVEIIPTQMKLPEDAQLTLIFPLLGPVTFTPLFEAISSLDHNEKRVSKGFQATIPSDKKPFVWGPLTIEKGVFKIIEGKLSYTGIATMFGKNATIGLKDFSLKTAEGSSPHLIASTGKPIEVYRLVVGLTFGADVVALELIPGKKIELKSIDLTFEEDKGVSFVQTFEFLGQKVEFSANIDIAKKELNLKAELSECKLVALIPELQGSLIQDFTLKGLLYINPLKGIIFTGSLMNKAANKVTVAGISFDEAHIDIDTAKKRALISGKTTVLTIPIQGYFAVFLGSTKGAKFAINIPSGVENWKPFEKLAVPALSDVTINSVKAGFYTQYVAMTQTTQTKDKAKTETKKEEKSETKNSAPTKEEVIKDIETIIKDAKTKDTTSDKIAKAITESKTYTSEVFDSVVTNGDDVTLTGEKGFTAVFYIAGRSTILNIVSDVMLKVGTAPGAAFNVALFARLPEGWKLSQSFPDLKPKSNNPNDIWSMICAGIDTFKIDDVMVYAGTTDETFNGVKIDPGFNISAAASIDTSVDNIFIKDLIKNGLLREGAKGASMAFSGNIDPRDPKNASFKMNLSSGGFGIPMGPLRFEAADVGLVLRARPSVGIAGGFTMIPAKGEQPLQFYIDLAFSPVAFGVSMSMKNIWKDPFGVKGFEFGNLAGNVTQTYTAIAEGIATGSIAFFVPAAIGLTGETKIGVGPCFSPETPGGKSLCAKAGINLGKDISNFALFVDITNPMSIVLLAEILLQQMNASADILRPIEQLFPIKIKRGKLYFVPLGTNIGEIKIQQGIGAALYLDIFGREAHIDCSIGLDGLTAKGKLPAFDFGIIKMTNHDDTCNTQLMTTPKPEESACGPTIDIQANSENVHFIIDGLMKLGPLLQSKTKWYISTKGIHFETESFIGSEKAKLGIKIVGASISIEDQAKLFSLTPKDLSLEITFEDTLSEYLRENIIKELRSSQAIFEKSINQAMEQVARDTIQKDIANQEAAVKQAESRRVLCKDDVGLCIKREIEVQGEIAKLNALKIKMQFEKSPIAKFFQNVGRKLGFDKAAQSLLMDVKKIGTGANEQLILAFQDISRLVVIKKASWKGSLDDLGKGVIPSLELIICTGCKEIKYATPPFALADPFKSIDAIAKTVVEIIKQVIIGALSNEKCDNVCGIKESEITNAMDTELGKHVLYWQEKGEIDEKGQRYDGDYERGQFLLNKMRQENPAMATQLEPYMLPDVARLHARLDVLTHIRYWSEKGRTDAQGRHYDGDPARARMLLENLRKLDPAAADELAQKMLPDPICADLAEHNEYWRTHGGVDRDTSGKGQRLLNECRKYSPAFAPILEKEMMPVASAEFAPKIAAARAELDKHIDYWSKNGRKDPTGRRYDGDPARWRMLLENLRNLDPAAAAEYQPRALPDPICADLVEHIDYWKAHGGKDGDPKRGQWLLSECKKYTPSLGAELEKKMLPT